MIGEYRSKSEIKGFVMERVMKALGGSHKPLLSVDLSTLSSEFQNFCFYSGIQLCEFWFILTAAKSLVLADDSVY